MSDTTFHETYHPLREVEQYIHTLAAVRPENVKLDYIGWSTEKKPLISISISRLDDKKKKKKKSKKMAEKPAFVIMGAQHAREVSLSYVITLPVDIIGNPSGFQLLRPFI